LEFNGTFLQKVGQPMRLTANNYFSPPWAPAKRRKGFNKIVALDFHGGRDAGHWYCCGTALPTFNHAIVSTR